LKKNRKRLFIVIITIIIIFVFSCAGLYYSFIYDGRQGIFDSSIIGKRYAQKDYPIKGIDLSHHNGNVSWAKLNDAKGDHNIRFIIFKATESKSVADRTFAGHFANARRHNFIAGAYHFFIPWIPAKMQARNYIRHVHLHSGDLPPIVDIERYSKIMSRNRYQQNLLKMLQILEKHYGAVPIIYCHVPLYEYYFNNYEFRKYSVWLAVYRRRMVFNDNWIFWQYTEKGRLSGIGYNVDVSVFNDKKYGSLKNIVIK
jgi:lysozyme